MVLPPRQKKKLGRVTLIMERDTLALSAPLQRNSPVHGLVKLPPFASSYKIGKNQEKSINETVVSSISTY